MQFGDDKSEPSYWSAGALFPALCFDINFSCDRIYMNERLALGAFNLCLSVNVRQTAITFCAVRENVGTAHFFQNQHCVIPPFPLVQDSNGIHSASFLEPRIIYKFCYGVLCKHCIHVRRLWRSIGLVLRPYQQNLSA